MSSKYEAMCLTCSLSVESGPNFKSVGKKGVPATWDDLKNVKAQFKSESKIWALHSGSLDKPSAYVLVIKNGLEELLSKVESDTKDEDVFQEILNVPEEKIDDWVKIAGKWCKKKARQNTNIGHVKQDRDLDKSQCTVIPYSEMPHCDTLKKAINSLGVDKFQDLNIEVNYYPKDGKGVGGIGWHGDGERNIVFAINWMKNKSDKRFLQFQYYEKSSQVGDHISIPLEYGDIYIMDKEAGGFDWVKKRSKKGILHVRHRAGKSIYLDQNDKIVLSKEKRKLKKEQENKRKRMEKNAAKMLFNKKIKV